MIHKDRKLKSIDSEFSATSLSASTKEVLSNRVPAKIYNKILRKYERYKTSTIWRSRLPEVLSTRWGRARTS
jgi:hypothetical protein